MDEILPLALALIVGMLLGLFFFGGLWWTVKNGLRAYQPVLWFFGSLVIRMTVTLAGFYMISRDHWERAILCLVGFLVARAIVTRFTRSSSANQVSITKEVNHEN
jgi:F1F0 ATPase subunit 2